MADTTGAQDESTPPVNDWSSTLFTVLGNQLIILSLGAFLTIGLVSESRKATDAMEFAVPPTTLFYFDLGSAGILGIAFLSLVASALCIPFRKSFLSVVMISCSFISAAMFLGIGIFYAVAPLYAALRMALPADRVW